MQHLLYEVPTPQAQLLDFSSSSLLFFFNYESRYQLKSFPPDLLDALTLVFLGHDFFPLQQWTQAENFSKPIRWSGPEGLNSSLCASLEIHSVPVFIGFQRSQVVYFSKDWPSARFLQDFRTGDVKSIMHEVIQTLVVDMVENATLVAGSAFSMPQPDEKSFADTISLLQGEIVHFQNLCKQQQLVIEALREELADKARQVQTLSEIV
jgi:hypothetical protein